MRRLNVTLAVEEDLLREARAVAARRRTSVNEMVREFLKDLVSQESRRLAALERIQPFLDHPPVHLGGSLPSRSSGEPLLFKGEDFSKTDVTATRTA